ncbi:MAG: DNA mismatch repair endonuclease MutL [Bacteroidaceae bacterium]|nr:DNA mismatch repair endonuclease MutL [Bacteroidaceae bacterium]
MDIIQLLPDTVANQIAAGEVIERPASVIKELVENSIDAGAQHINVVVVDAGRTLIRVIDDGKGMSPTDARLAFEHHATSKIRKADDLFALHTMGFRGEALATIAAVAQVELRTRQADDEIGTLINIAGSKVENQEAVSCPVGSSFSVKNIFFNIPARRKFLKSDAAELNNILTIFERIALVYPDISFTFHVGEVEKYNLRAGQQLQRIVDIFGAKMHQDLVPVNVETTICKLSGFVGKPESSKKKGAKQFFFVNGRYMRHPYFHKAVTQAVERMIPSGEQVPYFLYLDVKPEDIDVNVSPTKTEIKFDNEQTIWQIINAAIKDAIGQFSEIPSIDFNAENRPEIPVYEDAKGSRSNYGSGSPTVNVNTGYNPFKPSGSSSRSAAPADWEVFYEAAKDIETLQEQPLQDGLFDEPGSGVGDIQDSKSNAYLEEKSSIHYQYKGQYIMTAVKSGLLVVDQHRAHVRVLYERFMKQLEKRNAPSQKVLFPEIIAFSAEEENTLQEINADLIALGFEITSLGGGSYAINGTPAGMEGINIVKLLQDIISSVGATAKEAVNSIIAERLANNAAISYGEILDAKEMEQLVADLFLCSNFNYTPSGKNIMTIIDDIEFKFR